MVACLSDREAREEQFCAVGAQNIRQGEVGDKGAEVGACVIYGRAWALLAVQQ